MRERPHHIDGAWGLSLDPSIFDPASIPAHTRATIERLRRGQSDGGGPGVLREEPRSARGVDRVIDSSASRLRLRVLPAGEARACYLHLHGGGWALGAADRQDQTLLAFARTAELTVVSLEYRLAPEHPHPAAVDDCVAALRWLAANGPRELGPARVIVGGESVGAHISALAMLALRNQDELAGVVAANLAYGVYDVSMTPSARRWGQKRIVVSTPDLAFFAGQYAPPGRHRDPDVSPLYADLTGLPPTLFSCGTLDPMLDDTLFMAARWQEAGNKTQLALYPGAPHEFLNLRDPISAEQEARARMVDFIERVLDG